jgi:hypothetical protein
MPAHDRPLAKEASIKSFDDTGGERDFPVRRFWSKIGIGQPLIVQRELQILPVV